MKTLKTQIVGKETSGETILYFANGSDLIEFCQKIKSQEPVDGELFDVLGKVNCVDGAVGECVTGIRLTIHWKKHYGK